MGEPAFEIIKSPGIGDVGRKIKVRTNFFKVNSMQETNISHYDVNIIPVVPPRANKDVQLNMEIFNRFVEQNQQALGNTRPVFDGKKNMFSPKVLPFGPVGNFIVELEEGTTSRRQPRKFKLIIKKTRDINLEELSLFTQRRGNKTKNCEMAIMAMDIIIIHKISTEYPTIHRSFYNPQTAKPLSGGLEAWRGYYQSARPTMKGMMINIDLSITAFYESGPLVQLIIKLLGFRTPNDLRRGFSINDYHKVEKYIKNLKIRENHRNQNRRKFKINGLTPEPASRTMFDMGDGSQIDVKTYFQNTYNRPLEFPSLPCVVVKRNVYLPIEVCDVIEGQRCMRKLNRRQTDEMINFARQNPGVRTNMIQDGFKILNYRGNKYLQQFEMSISNEMEVANARILPTPKIEYHQSSKAHHVQPKDGVWNLRDKKLAVGATLGSWSVLAFLSENDLPDRVIDMFMREFVSTCQNTGLNIPTKRPPILRANPIGDVEDSLKKAWLKAGNTAKAKPQLILCILPDKGKDLYGEIKRVSDTVIGVATQCIQSEQMNRPKPQYCANVCLKMNVKIGGMNSFVVPEHVPFLAKEPTILIGADVSHPAPDDNEGPSFAALCGSVDPRGSRYAASIRIQTGRYEIIVDLANMVKDLLKKFYQNSGEKPRRIIFYRDGVSESQFVKVLQDEMNAIKGACQALDATYKPTVTYVVVQKRHHTRFFPMEKGNSDRSGNCLPGTVVDSDITHPFEFDFYLQSHAGLLGTSRPAHYYVLYDKNGFNANSMQTLSYNLCYIYARCTRSVSLVPPVYYAHLVTNRAKLHLRNEPGAATEFGTVKEDLQKVMYFV